MSTAPAKQTYRKHYIPLESNPEVFTELIHNLGVSSELEFVDVYSINDPEILAFVPRPVYALILVFPTSDSYESRVQNEESTRTAYQAKGNDEKVIWFRQTINNACGLYGILHAVSNGGARSFIANKSPLAQLLVAAVPLDPVARALLLEDSNELEQAHRKAALQGDSAVPESAEDEVDYHYVCFAKSNKDEHLYELDGDKKGPIDLGPMQQDEDLLGEKALQAVRTYIAAEKGEKEGFSLLALVSS